MLGFEVVKKEEQEIVGSNKQVNEFTMLLKEFENSGEEVGKVNGFDMTEAITVYHRLKAAAKKTNVAVSKRGQNVYLLNKGLNPVATAPEKR